VNTADDLDTEPVGAEEEDAAAWLGDVFVLEGVRVTPTNADPTTEEKDALTLEELLLGAAPESELDVVVVVVVMVVENGEGVNVLPTKATPTEDEYEPLISLDVLAEEVNKVLELVSSEELDAVIDEVVEVTVLVTGVGVI
jgi:hypothetical protein